MNHYQVTAGSIRYVMQARSISHAEVFTRHWGRVRIVRVWPKPKRATWGFMEMTARST